MIDSKQKQTVDQFLDEHSAGIRDLLDRLVAQPSFITNTTGVEAVADIVLDAMPAGFSHERIPDERFADHHILIRPATHSDDAMRVVLAGHLDTLCPIDPNFDRVTEVEDRLVGPGVMDMKGGDVVFIWALRCLEMLGKLDDLNLTVIFNSDEEFGSPSSNPIFQSMADRADVALVYEASAPQGSIVTTRRSIWRCRASFEGVEHHFGMLRDRKVSAVQEAAHQTLQLESLNEADGNVLVNVGRIEGGLAANKVGHEAAIEFEIRCWDGQLLEKMIDKAKKLLNTPFVEGVKSKIEQLSYRPPMQLQPSQRWLFETAQAIGKELGLTVEEEHRSGVSDACWLSHVGIATLDGMGPRGDHDFTPDEFCYTSSIRERIELTVHLLLALIRRKAS